MTNSHFIKKLARELNLKKEEISKTLAVITSSFSQALSAGEEIRLKNLGVLAVHRYPPRRIPDPARPGRYLNLAAQNVVKFYPSVSLKERLQFTKQKEKQEKPLSLQPIHIPYLDPSKLAVPKEVLSLIPERIARKYQIAPIEKNDNVLVVAMIDPEDEEALGIVRKQTGLELSPRICTSDGLKHILNQYSSIQGGEVKEIAGVELKTEEKAKKVKEKDISEEAPASKIIYSLVKRAVRMKASDIHIEAEDKEVTIRFRIDGVLQKILSLPKEIQEAVISRVKILSGMKIDETRLPQDGRFQTVIDQREIDFRVSVIPTVYGEKVVARILDKATGVLSLEELGLTGLGFKILEENIRKAHGMILVTGPTGSGKTTTLYAVIKKIQDIAINITTLEDPVEYRLNGVNQSQVNADIGFTFGNGLRSLVRQDPDVIMIGEIRDFETAEMAIQSALTGHIVLSTLHTNDAAGAIPRLIDMKVEPFLVSSSLNVVLAQRLCRQICQQCKQKNQPGPEHKTEIGKVLKRLRETKIDLPQNQTDIYQGKGCASCGNSGYKGRVGIFEVLDVTDKINNLIIARANSSQILSAALSERMITMNEDGVMKALNGLTTMEEVWRVTRE